jgi:phage major head subunit gpT-like protein
MSLEQLGSRAIIGEYYARLEQDAAASWMSAITNYFSSNQESETYKWLGQVPALREWIGGRQAKGLRVQGYTIKNVLYEATLELFLDDLRRDKTGQIRVRIAELAARTNAHWAKLLSTLINAGPSAVCYDGQFFFDTDHVEGDSGSQSNDISHAAATGTTPTAGEFSDAILEAVEAMYGFKDDQGEPINENAKRFLVMVQPAHLKAAAAALNNPIIIDGSTSRTNTLVSLGGWEFELAVNARFSVSDAFTVWRTDGDIQPLIRQEEVGVEVSAIAEGSELEFRERKHQYGVSAIRNVGYGLWQRAVMVTFT